MPEYLTPGVYVEEFEIGARPIGSECRRSRVFRGSREGYLLSRSL